MAESIFQQPTNQQLAAFVKGDPIAIDEVIHILLPQLYRWAVRQYANVAQDEVQSIVNQVLAEACRNHARYDPQKAYITTYLIGLINLRLKTLYRSTQKTKFEESFPERQENLPGHVYYLTSGVKIDYQLERERFFEKVGERLDEVEREVLALMLIGEKSQDAFVAIMSRDTSLLNSADTVKNFKERLKRKIKTIAEEMGYVQYDLLDE